MPVNPTGDDNFGREPEQSFTITELAQEFDLTVRTLRFYEDKGLISPRRLGLRRIYSCGDRGRIARIVKARALGFALTEIPELISTEVPGDPYALNITPEKCLQQISLLQEDKKWIDDAITELRQTLSQKEGHNSPSTDATRVISSSSRLRSPRGRRANRGRNC